MSNSRRGFFRDLASVVASAKDSIEPPQPEPPAADLSEAEIERNPRSRSARLRVARKLRDAGSPRSEGENPQGS